MFCQGIEGALERGISDIKKNRKIQSCLWVGEESRHGSSSGKQKAESRKKKEKEAEMLNITTKQRAYLRSMATQLDTIMQVGKGGISPTMVKTVSDALEARELIKMRVLENSGETVRSVAEALAEATDATVVGVIGSKMILYRPASDPGRRRIALP